MKTSTNHSVHVSKGDRLNWVHRDKAGTTKLDPSKIRGTLVTTKKGNTPLSSKKVVK